MSNYKDTALDQLVSEIRETANQIRKQETAKKTGRLYFRTRATRHVTDHAQDRSLQNINSYEHTSIRALMAWSANEQGAAPETVEAMTEVHFKVEQVADLPRKDYDEVIRFLIDLRIDEMKH